MVQFRTSTRKSQPPAGRFSAVKIYITKNLPYNALIYFPAYIFPLARVKNALYGRTIVRTFQPEFVQIIQQTGTAGGPACAVCTIWVS